MSNRVTDFDRFYENLDIKDKSNPKSLVNMCPQVMAERIAVIPDSIFEIGESDLIAKANPTGNEEQLRISFWEEYKRADRTNSKMNMSNVYSGFVTKEYFYRHVITNSFKLAYIILPPKEVQILLEEITLLGLKRQKDWLLIEPVDDQGKVNVKLGMLHQRITEDSLNRRRGHVLRQMEVTNKNLNVNVNHTSQTPTSVEEINRQLAELEEDQSNRLTYTPQDNIIPAAYKDVSHEKIRSK